MQQLHNNLGSFIPDQIALDVKEHTMEFLWPVLVSLALIAGGMQFGKQARVSWIERIVGYWYLWNGVWIHLFLDVGMGYFRRVPSLSISYALLDKRFDPVDPLIQTALFVELFLQAPGCLCLCYGFFTRQRWRHPLQIFVCSLHLSTTIFYAMTSLVAGLPSLPVDWDLEFTPQHIFYFWICFVLASLMWTVVPLLLAAYSMRVLSVQVARLEKMERIEEQPESRPNEALLVTEAVLTPSTSHASSDQSAGLKIRADPTRQ